MAILGKMSTNLKYHLSVRHQGGPPIGAIDDMSGKLILIADYVRVATCTFLIATLASVEL